MAPTADRRFWRWLALAVILHFGFGVVLGTGLVGGDRADKSQGVALLSRDDVANVAMSYSLYDGQPVVLPEQPPYGFLYPALLAPAWAIGLDESGVVVWAQVLNAAIGALTVLTLYAFGRALYGASVGEERVLVAALVAGSMPSVWLYSSIAWPERLLALGVAVVALVLARAESARAMSFRWVVGSAVVVAAIHPRGSIVAIVALAGVAIIGGPSSQRSFRVGLLAVGLVELLRRIVQSSAFESEGSYNVVSIAQRREMSDIPEMVLKGLGTVAALTIATCGIAVLGFAILLKSGRAGQTMAAIMAVTVIVSGVFLAGVTTSDAWLYGRYIEAVAGPAVLVGVIDPFGWWRQPKVLASVVAVFLGIAVVAIAAVDDFDAVVRSRTMTIGVEVFGAFGGADQFRPVVAVMAAVLVGTGLWLLALWSSRVAAGALVAALAVGVWSVQQTRADIWVESAARAVQKLNLPTDANVSLDTQLTPITSASAAAMVIGFKRLGPLGSNSSYAILATGEQPPSDAARVSDGAGLTLWLLP